MVQASDIAAGFMEFAASSFSTASDLIGGSEAKYFLGSKAYAFQIIGEAISTKGNISGSTLAYKLVLGELIGAGLFVGTVCCAQAA